MFTIDKNHSHPHNPNYFRIRSLRDIPSLGVKEGDLGGYTSTDSDVVLRGDSWIGDEAVVIGSVTLHNTLIDEEAYVNGSISLYYSVVKGKAAVLGNSEVLRSTIDDCAYILDSKIINSEVSASVAYSEVRDSKISGYAELRWGKYLKARITNTSESFTLNPIGSEDSTVTFYPDLDGKPYVTVGCWDGYLEDLPAEVNRRFADRNFEPADETRWRSQYKAFQTLAETYAQNWSSNV